MEGLIDLDTHLRIVVPTADMKGYGPGSFSALYTPFNTDRNSTQATFNIPVVNWPLELHRLQDRGAKLFAGSLYQAVTTKGLVTLSCESQVPKEVMFYQSNLSFIMRKPRALLGRLGLFDGALQARMPCIFVSPNQGNAVYCEDTLFAFSPEGVLVVAQDLENPLVQEQFDAALALDKQVRDYLRDHAQFKDEKYKFKS